MKTKTFDCLKMKDEAQQRQGEALKGLSEQERLDYYGRAHDALVERQKRLRARLGHVPDDVADSGGTVA